MPANKLRLDSRVERQTETGLVQILGGQESLGWDRLVQEQVAKHGQHALAVGAVGQILLERCVGLADDEVVAVRTTGVRHDGDVVGSGHGRHAEQLGQAAEPHDVWLDDVQVAALDQLPEAVSAVLMLTGGELEGRVCALDLRKAIRVIGRQALLPPVDVEVLALFGNLNCVRHVERHVAVHHEREVRADGFAVLAQELDILLEPRVPLLGTVRKGHLGAPKAHGLGGRGLGSCAVKIEALLGGAADEAVDGLVAQLAKEIPQRQVDDGDDGDGETFATVEHGPAVHLLKEQVCVAWVGANQESLKVLVDEPAARRTAEARREAHGSVAGLDLDQKGAQDIDAPAGSGFAVLFPL